MGQNMKDKMLAWVERTASRVQNWAWDKRFKYRDQNEWIKGYNEWKKKTKCPHN